MVNTWNSTFEPPATTIPAGSGPPPTADGTQPPPQNTEGQIVPPNTVGIQPPPPPASVPATNQGIPPFLPGTTDSLFINAPSRVQVSSTIVDPRGLPRNNEPLYIRGLEP